MAKVILFLVMSLVIMATMNSCGSSSTTPDPGPTAAELTTAGWDLYASGDLTGAVAKFEECIASFPNHAEAYAGAGWAALDDGLLADADSFFTTGNTKSPAGDSLYMIRIGLASITLLDNATPATVGTAIVGYLSTIVSIPDTWVHPHNSKISAVDLHTLLAEGYIKRGSAYYGSEAGSASNALDAWGQVKKALAISASDDAALRLQNHLKGL